jgi:hypothetical protein
LASASFHFDGNEFKKLVNPRKNRSDPFSLNDFSKIRKLGVIGGAINIADDVISLASQAPGSEIPKPNALAPFLIKGMGTRRGEAALIYMIPSHTGRRPYEKGITFSEFTLAHAELERSGEFTTKWFKTHLAGCAKEGSCNFTSIGGVLEMLGLARYSARGRYVSTSSRGK